MDSSSKLKFLAIRKFEMRNCCSIPVAYIWNEKSWMTCNIFEKWFKEWDPELVSQNRKVRLIIDNCTPPHVDVALSNIEVVFAS